MAEYALTRRLDNSLHFYFPLYYNKYVSNYFFIFFIFMNYFFKEQWIEYKVYIYFFYFLVFTLDNSDYSLDYKIVDYASAWAFIGLAIRNAFG